MYAVLGDEYFNRMSGGTWAGFGMTENLFFLVSCVRAVLTRTRWQQKAEDASRFRALHANLSFPV